MAVYSKMDVSDLIKDGIITSHPFVADNLDFSCLNLTLGHYFFRIEGANQNPVYNPLDREDSEHFFDGPYKAIPHKEWCDLNRVKPIRHVPLDYPVISLKPGEHILAHSHEFIGAKHPVALEILCTNAWSQNGLAITGPGWINPGFANRLTFKIHNYSHKETILLPIGEKIAQVVFHQVGLPINDSETIKKSTPSLSLESVIAEWSPDQLLPKAYQTKRILPQKIEGLSYD